MQTSRRFNLEIRLDESLYSRVKSSLSSGNQEHPYFDGSDGNRAETCVQVNNLSGPNVFINAN